MHLPLKATTALVLVALLAAPAFAATVDPAKEVNAVKTDVLMPVGSLTPMTPVDATSTDDESAPSACAVRPHISRACCIPSAPVHALAQPLLTTIAWIPPPVAACSRETRIGAACARFVVNTAAATAGTSQAMTARSGRPLALIPHATPAARKPAGAVTLPSTRS